MKTSERFLKSSTFKAMPEAQSPIVFESPRERNKYKLALRVFDGNLNETREQALKNFERQYGFNPMKEIHEAGKSPEKIKENV
jgi:hypothetical protein